VTRLSEHEEVFARGALLRATVICLWLFGIGRAVARTFGPIRPNRGGSAVRRVRLTPRGQLCRGAGRQPCVVGSGVIEPGMEHVHPLVRMRLTHPKERSLHRLHGMLLHVSQHEQPVVRPRREGRIVRRTVASAGAGLAIDGAVLQRGRQRALKMWQQRGKFWLRSPRHRP
jgi:hypothetical protein